MGTFEIKRDHHIKTFQIEDGTWVTHDLMQELVLDVEFLPNRTEIWIVLFDNAGRRIQRWNASFVRSIIWEK